MKTVCVIVAAALLLAGCGKPQEDTSPVADGPAEQPAAAAPAVADYAAAVANPARSATDRERDAGRKPAEVLEFFGIQPGMRVLDVFSGGGYYSEILAYVVGPDGSISAHNNEAYAQYVGQEMMTRYGGDRLPNVDVLMAENNELALEADTYDAALLILSFHDIFYVDPDNGWPQIDGGAFLAEIHKGLKPGGIVGIVDHSAAAGAARETGNTLHRIDPAIVIADMEAAGFVLDAQSEILRNSDDDHSMNMADPQVRGRTDRFVMRFSKP